MLWNPELGHPGPERPSRKHPARARTWRSLAATIRLPCTPGGAQSARCTREGGRREDHWDAAPGVSRPSVFSARHAMPSGTLLQEYCLPPARFSIQPSASRARASGHVELPVPCHRHEPVRGRGAVRGQRGAFLIVASSTATPRRCRAASCVAWAGTESHARSAPSDGAHAARMARAVVAAPRMDTATNRAHVDVVVPGLQPHVETAAASRARQRALTLTRGFTSREGAVAPSWGPPILD